MSNLIACCYVSKSSYIILISYFFPSAPPSKRRLRSSTRKEVETDKISKDRKRSSEMPISPAAEMEQVKSEMELENSLGVVTLWKRHAKFNIEAVTNALEGTDPLKVIPDKLTCADYEAMKQGEMLEVADVYDVTSRKFKLSPHGFQIPKRRMNKKRDGAWHHQLFCYEKVEEDKYVFINSSQYYKSAARLSGIVDRKNSDLVKQVFYEKKGCAKRVRMREDRVYVHSVSRYHSPFANKDLRIKELVIMRVYNEDSKRLLENRGYYHFTKKCKKFYESNAGELLPHPHFHAPGCEFAINDDKMILPD